PSAAGCCGGVAALFPSPCCCVREDRAIPPADHAAPRPPEHLCEARRPPARRLRESCEDPTATWCPGKRPESRHSRPAIGYGLLPTRRRTGRQGWEATTCRAVRA